MSNLLWYCHLLLGYTWYCDYMNFISSMPALHAQDGDEQTGSGNNEKDDDRKKTWAQYAFMTACTHYIYYNTLQDGGDKQTPMEVRELFEEVQKQQGRYNYN